VRNGAVLAHHGVLAKGTVAEHWLENHPEHLVADREPGGARAKSVDCPGEVPAEHHREAMLHPVPDVPGRDREVEAVD